MKDCKPETGAARPARKTDWTALMTAIPLKEFLSLVTAGIARPRPVARRIIDARPGQGDRLAMVALGGAMQGTLWALATLAAPSLALGLQGHLMMIAVTFVNYALTTALALHVGRRFGGQGAPEQVATAVAWHIILVAALTPLQALAVAGGGVLMLLFYAALNVWLLAACVAEAHRFASTGKVAAATVGLFLALGIVLSLLVGGLGGLPQ
jgi:hypothetical protein